MKNRIKYLLIIVILILLGLTLSSCNLITYELNIIIDPVEQAGTVSTDPQPEDGLFEKDTIVTLTPEPADGWIFKQWVVNDVIFPADSYPTYDIKMNEDKTIKAVFEAYTLTINVDPTEGGNVTLDPDKEYYEPNEEVTLTAVPAQGYGFSMWLGDLSGSDNPVTITMDRAKEITTVFETFTLTVDSQPELGGNVTITPDKPNYAPGEQVTLEAVPVAGYNFINWTGDYSGNDNPATITMDNDKVITAVFDTNTLTINIYPDTDADGNPADPGDVTLDPSGGNYATGTTVNLTATENAKWKFSNWGGPSIGFLNDNGDGTASITMDQDHVISATYSEQWELTLNIVSVEDPPIVSDVQVDVDDPGNVDANGYYAPGTVLTLTPVPAANHSLSEWTGVDSADIQDNGDGTFSLLMNGDKEIEANFIEGHRLYISSTPTGVADITVTDAPNAYGVYPTGTVVTITPTVLDNDYSLAEFIGTHGVDVIWNDVAGEWQITMDETKFVNVKFKLIGSESTEVDTSVSPQMWSGRQEHEGLSFDGKIWVIGGRADSGLMNDVWYSTDGETWAEATNSAGWTARNNFAAAVYDDGTGSKMWVLGGNAGGNSNDVWYSSDGITWTEVDTSASAGGMWSSRNSHVAASFDGKLWIMGGQNASQLNDVWYTSDGANWYEATSGASWSGRAYLQAETWDHDGTGEKLYIIGGLSGPSSDPTNFGDDIWFTSDGVDWYQLSFTPQPGGNWGRRSWHETIIYNNKMWVMGGAFKDGALGWIHYNDVWFSENGIDWVQVGTNTTDSEFWGGRSSFGSAVGDSKMWVLGGASNTGTKLNDVWFMD